MTDDSADGPPPVRPPTQREEQSEQQGQLGETAAEQPGKAMPEPATAEAVEQRAAEAVEQPAETVPGERAAEQPGETAAEAAPPPPPPRRRRRTGLVVTIGGAVVVALLCVAGGLVVAGAIRGEVPAVGDCLTDAADPNDMAVVGCAEGQAAWQVIGTDGELTRGEFGALPPDADLCQEHPGTGQALWVTDALFGVDDSTVGTVVCLGRTGEPASPDAAG